MGNSKIKYCFCLLCLLFLTGCKNKFGNEGEEIKSIIKENRGDQVKEYDFSSISKDTLFIKGKQILLVGPSNEEFEIIKEEKGTQKLKNKFDLCASVVVDSLKNESLVTVTKKRILAIITDRDTTYIDRLFSKSYKRYNHYAFYFIDKCRFTKYDFGFYDNCYEPIEILNTAIRCENVIEQKYVVARNGVNVRDHKNRVIGKLKYGEIANVVGYSKEEEVWDEGEKIKGHWAIVKYEDFMDGRRIKKGYVFDAFLGDMGNIKVFEDQMCIGHRFSEGTMYSNNETSNSELKCLSEYFDFEFISKETYESLPNKSYTLQINPSVKIEKNNDRTENIVLPIKDSVLTFDNEINYHEYYGDVDFLNQYLIHGDYYKAEESLYHFIDKTTGKESYMFSGLPRISPNKKKIVVLNYDIYEDRFFIELYKISEKGAITFKNSYYFPYWRCSYRNDYKWVSDNEFAIEIIPTAIRDNENLQYLKIKIKD